MLVGITRCDVPVRAERTELLRVRAKPNRADGIPLTAYVAVSRVRSLAGLHIKECFKGVQVREPAIRFHKEGVKPRMDTNEHKFPGKTQTRGAVKRGPNPQRRVRLRDTEHRNPGNRRRFHERAMQLGRVSNPYRIATRPRDPVCEP